MTKTNSQCDILVGGQWGDEGKAKIIDYLAENYDIICRYQGGSNAGHTVVHQGQKYIFHLIPSGILNPHITGVLGNGMVICLKQLLSEIKALQERGIDLKERLKVSDRAFLVTDYHLEMDQVKEKKDLKIGTTMKGIGPAYTDKYSREGIRISDLYHPDYLIRKITESLKVKQSLFQHYYKYRSSLHAEKIVQTLLDEFQMIRSYVVDSVYFFHTLQEEKKILLEGAQGTGLDIDFGTYPYVTSSSPISGGACIGTGIPPTHLNDIFGIFKSYVTRVGKGALPTLLTDNQENILRKKGGEFGATTGRSRNCGWFDGVQAKYSVIVNGINRLVLTKLDVLTGFDTVKFCTHYQIQGETTEYFPASLINLEQARPIYKEFPGWDKGVFQVKKFNELHPHARRFIDFLEEYLETKVSIISTGPEREHTLIQP